MPKKIHAKSTTEELYIRSKTPNTEFELRWRKKQCRRWMAPGAILIALITITYSGNNNHSKSGDIQEDGAVHGQMVPSNKNCIITNQNGHLSYLSCDSAGGTLVYTVTTPRGSNHSSITLPDKTNIWMNAASTLELKIVAGIVQSIIISGEANFDISPAVEGKQTAWKLYIKDRNINIEAPAGARFNVSAYADDPIIETSQFEGHGIKINSNGKSTTLAAARQAQFHGTTLSIVKISDKSSGTGKVWRGDKFNYKAADLKLFMKQVGRVHDMEVEYKRQVPKIHLYAELDQDTELLSVLGALREMGIRSTIKDRKIIIGTQ